MYGPCVEPWLTCCGGGQDEQIEWPEWDWSLIDYPVLHGTV